MCAIASMSVPAVNLQGGVLLAWVGYDGSYNEEEVADFSQAEQRALKIEEYGGHSICIADVDTDD